MTDDRTLTYQKIRYPHWQREFEAALLERDPQKLREHVDAAEAAMFQRSQALVESANGHVEQQAIADAIRTLRTIQRESSAIQSGTKITARLLYTTVCKTPLLRQPRPSAERIESIFMLHSATRQWQENARLPDRGTFLHETQREIGTAELRAKIARDPPGTKSRD